MSHPPSISPTSSTGPTSPHPTPEERRAIRDYDRVAAKAAAVVIAGYSTSFGAASALLRGRVRERVRCVYALVRVADEIVDGAAGGAGLDASAVTDRLGEYERETERALATGFSTDLVVHAFASAARATGIDVELTKPFFASMRMDVERSTYDADGFSEYVHGSAEAVGLMCLRIFATGSAPRPIAPDEGLIDGARRLGAAFQKVNFLRDLRADHAGRGRDYFPGIDPAHLDEDAKTRLLDDVDADLEASRRAIRRLPRSSRAAVQAAHDLFAALADALRSTPAERLRSTRVRVSNPRKAVIWVGALTGLGARRLGHRDGVPRTRRWGSARG